ncbi:hypothetical protein SAMN05421780_11070 [Flexibacter flexilis DSM 6793]|uniref:Uncharacterized protein n=1 Tax=Flexibacter flexilis DSM 6793 TaxID=927664 RepID=A0A1I1M7W4_9BACT|nr:hypothetical protein [Flexibacter flexilis]SFC81499.1 hypothetical protein SAMN05421780_11070 [Flexibacter flexilis DSM 6793]
MSSFITYRGKFERGTYMWIYKVWRNNVLKEETGYSKPKGGQEKADKNELMRDIFRRLFAYGQRYSPANLHSIEFYLTPDPADKSKDTLLFIMKPLRVEYTAAYDKQVKYVDEAGRTPYACWQEIVDSAYKPPETVAVDASSGVFLLPTATTRPIGTASAVPLPTGPAAKLISLDRYDQPFRTLPEILKYVEDAQKSGFTSEQANHWYMTFIQKNEKKIKF